MDMQEITLREEEAFYILDGTIVFTADGRRFTATPGSYAHLPPGVPHAFRNESDRPATMLILLAPAGLENMFLEVGTLLPDASAVPPRPGPVDIARLKAAVSRYGIELLLPPGH